MRKEVCNLTEILGLLKCFNEEPEDGVRQPCRRCVGPAMERMVRSLIYFWVSPFKNGAMVSMGIGKMVVEFFSAATSTSV